MGYVNDSRNEGPGIRVLTDEKVFIREVKKEEISLVVDFVLRVFNEVYPFQLGDASRKQLLNM